MRSLMNLQRLFAVERFCTGITGEMQLFQVHSVNMLLHGIFCCKTDDSPEKEINNHLSKDCLNISYDSLTKDVYVMIFMGIFN